MIRRLLHITLSALVAVIMVVAMPGITGMFLNSTDKVSAATLLDLPRIPWEGGSDYWKQFPKADAAGWDDPSFFPIGVHLSNPADADELKAAGINTYLGANHTPPISTITSTGMFVIAQGTWLGSEWTTGEIGNDPNVVGWLASDECEMGYSGCADADLNGDTNIDQYDQLIKQQEYVDEVRDLNDGRFVFANYGNGVRGTFWSSNTMSDHIDLMDVQGADQYFYTSESVQGGVDAVHNSPDWPDGVPAERAYSYGWVVDQMLRFSDPNDRKPIWGAFVETAQPLLGELTAREILPDEIEGAVWSSLIHESRGLMYFQHNNGDDDCTAAYSIVDCPAVNAKVTDINEKVTSLAPVLNTQSYYNTSEVVNGMTYYRYSFGNNTDTMVKTYDDSMYVFAGLGMGDNTGLKTFTLPDDVEGTEVEVVGEGRTISVDPDDRTFEDTFAQEYSHHVYKVALSAEDEEEPEAEPDSDGISNAVENDAPNDGDANDDGELDSEQPNVASFVSQVSGKYVTLEVDDTCTITQVEMVQQPSTSDGPYSYPEGLMSFTLDCDTSGFKTTVRQLYHGIDFPAFELRKYDSNSKTYMAIPDSHIQGTERDSLNFVQGTYEITDGGELDEDGAANGTIVDPSGLAAGSLENTGTDSAARIMVAALITAVVVLVWRRSKFIHYRLIK